MASAGDMVPGSAGVWRQPVYQGWAVASCGTVLFIQVLLHTRKLLEGALCTHIHPHLASWLPSYFPEYTCGLSVGEGILHLAIHIQAVAASYVHQLFCPVEWWGAVHAALTLLWTPLLLSKRVRAIPWAMHAWVLFPSTSHCTLPLLSQLMFPAHGVPSEFPHYFSQRPIFLLYVALVLRPPMRPLVLVALLMAFTTSASCYLLLQAGAADPAMLATLSNHPLTSALLAVVTSALVIGYAFLRERHSNSRAARRASPKQLVLLSELQQHQQLGDAAGSPLAMPDALPKACLVAPADLVPQQPAELDAHAALSLLRGFADAVEQRRLLGRQALLQQRQARRQLRLAAGQHLFDSSALPVLPSLHTMERHTLRLRINNADPEQLPASWQHLIETQLQAPLPAGWVVTGVSVRKGSIHLTVELAGPPLAGNEDEDEDGALSPAALQQRQRQLLLAQAGEAGEAGGEPAPLADVAADGQEFSGHSGSTNGNELSFEAELLASERAPRPRPAAIRRVVSVRGVSGGSSGDDRAGAGAEAEASAAASGGWLGSRSLSGPSAPTSPPASEPLSLIFGLPGSPGASGAPYAGCASAEDSVHSGQHQPGAVGSVWCAMAVARYLEHVLPSTTVSTHDWSASVQLDDASEVPLMLTRTHDGVTVQVQAQAPHLAPVPQQEQRRTAGRLDATPFATQAAGQVARQQQAASAAPAGASSAARDEAPRRTSANRLLAGVDRSLYEVEPEDLDHGPALAPAPLPLTSTLPAMALQAAAPEPQQQRSSSTHSSSVPAVYAMSVEPAAAVRQAAAPITLDMKLHCGAEVTTSSLALLVRYAGPRSVYGQQVYLPAAVEYLNAIARVPYGGAAMDDDLDGDLDFAEGDVMLLRDDSRSMSRHGSNASNVVSNRMSSAGELPAVHGSASSSTTTHSLLSPTRTSAEAAAAAASGENIPPSTADYVTTNMGGGEVLVEARVQLWVGGLAVPGLLYLEVWAGSSIMASHPILLAPEGSEAWLSELPAVWRSRAGPQGDVVASLHLPRAPSQGRPGHRTQPQGNARNAEGSDVAPGQSRRLLSQLGQQRQQHGAAGAAARSTTHATATVTSVSSNTGAAGAGATGAAGAGAGAAGAAADRERPSGGAAAASLLTSDPLSVEELGCWIVYAAAIAGGHVVPPAPLQLLQMQPGLPQAAADAAARQAAYHSLMLKEGLNWLSDAVESGCPNLAQALLGSLLGAGMGLGEVLSRSHSPDGLPLLHSAVLSRSPAMVDHVWRWGEMAGGSWNWASYSFRLGPAAAAAAFAAPAAGAAASFSAAAAAAMAAAAAAVTGAGAGGAGGVSPGGVAVTPLHLAASLDDSGAMSRHILSNYLGSSTAWASGTTAAAAAPTTAAAGQHSAAQPQAAQASYAPNPEPAIDPVSGAASPPACTRIPSPAEIAAAAQQQQQHLPLWCMQVLAAAATLVRTSAHAWSAARAGAGARATHRRRAFLLHALRSLWLGSTDRQAQEDELAFIRYMQARHGLSLIGWSWVCVAVVSLAFLLACGQPGKPLCSVSGFLLAPLWSWLYIAVVASELARWRGRASRLSMHPSTELMCAAMMMSHGVAKVLQVASNYEAYPLPDEPHRVFWMDVMACSCLAASCERMRFRVGVPSRLFNAACSTLLYSRVGAAQSLAGAAAMSLAAQVLGLLVTALLEARDRIAWSKHLAACALAVARGSTASTNLSVSGDDDDISHAKAAYRLSMEAAVARASEDVAIDELANARPKVD